MALFSRVTVPVIRLAWPPPLTTGQPHCIFFRNKKKGPIRTLAHFFATNGSFFN